MLAVPPAPGMSSLLAKVYRQLLHALGMEPWEVAAWPPAACRLLPGHRVPVFDVQACEGGAW